MIRITETVKQLLIVTVIFYIGSNMVGEMAYQLFSDYYPQNPNFRFWQPLTSVFMHSPMPDLRHIVLNMLGLVMFGSTLEQLWGSKKFLFFYLSCGIGASLFNTAINYYHFQHGLQLLVESGQDPTEIMKILAEGKYDTNWEKLIPMSDFVNFMSSYHTSGIGASGALYGIFVAFAFMFPNAPVGFMLLPIQIKAKYFFGGLITIDLILGLNGGSIFGMPSTGIGHFAHVGGAVTGFIMMWYWKRNQFNKNRWN